MSSAETRSARAGRPAAREKRRLRKTKTPGVYRRIDRDGTTVGYVAVIVVAGRQRKRMAPTYDAARRLKREGETDRDRGVLEEHGTIRFVESSTSGSSGTKAKDEEASVSIPATNIAA